jgi:cytochrome c oxidase subunit I+III
MPMLGSSMVGIVGWLAVAASLLAANRSLDRNERGGVIVAVLVALAATWLAFGASLYALMGTNLRPHLHGYASTAYTMVAWQGLHAVLLTLMFGFTGARLSLGMIDSVRRNVFDNSRIMGYYCAAQGVLALVVMHSPRFVLG